MILIRPLSRSRSRTTMTTTIRPIRRTSCFLILLLTSCHIILPHLIGSSSVTVVAATITDDNDLACIDRTKIPPIKVIVHGDTKNDLVWKQIVAGMTEISNTMNIPMDVVSSIYTDTDTDDIESNNNNIRQNSNRNDIFNGFKNSGSSTDSDSSSYIQAMVADIQKYDTTTNNDLPPSAIIVSLPEDGSNDSRILNDAIDDLLQNTNIPIFGINAIPTSSSDNNDNDNTNTINKSNLLYGTVSMNNTYAGIIAGNYIKELLVLSESSSKASSKSSESSDSSNSDSSDSDSDSDNNNNNVDTITGVYINHRSDIHTLTERYNSISKTTIDIVSWEMFNLTTTGTNISSGSGSPTITSTSSPSPSSIIEDQLTTLFIGCSYKVIQLAASNDSIVDATIKALVSNGCNIGGNGNNDGNNNDNNENGNNNNNNNHIIIGAFDTSTLLYDAISHGAIQYTISQQPYLQGSYAMLMAALYVTTNSGIGNGVGIGIGSGNNNNNIQTGPILVTSDNVPYEKDQIQCENDNYPVCHNDNDDHNNNDDNSNDEKSCPCIDRSKISISVITHDDGSSNSNSKEDAFWDTLKSGITQAAIDFGVTIEKNKFISPRSNLRNGNHNHGYIAQKKLKHNFNIGEACSATTTGMNNDDKMHHGVIVTIPDKNMMNSLSECISRNVPYLIMNANAHGDRNSNGDGGNDNGMGVQQVEIATDGTTTTTDDGGGSLSSSSSSKSSSKLTSSSSLPLYIGQQDYKSGYDAGKRLLLDGNGGGSSKVKKGWCIVHSNYDTLYERCRGMKDAFVLEQEQKENNDVVEFIDIISVPNNGNSSTYKYIVESAISNYNRGGGNNDNDNDNDGDDENNDDDDWSEYGILSTGRIQIPSLISLLNDHPKLIAGTFDTDPALYQDNTNSQLLFAIDQNAYMQGYLSVATMVLKIITTSSSSSSEVITTTTSNNDSNIIETGPNFIDLQLTSNSDNPSDDDTIQIKKQRRQFENNYKVCAPTSATTTESDNTRDIKDIRPEEPPLKLSGKCKELGRLCENCEGDCDDDTQCGEGLVCFVRDSKTRSQDIQVPGCSTNPTEYTAKDFCVDASIYQCKDEESFPVKVGTFSVLRTCGYVQDDIKRCSEYGRYCRATCGYCRSNPHDGTMTDY